MDFSGAALAAGAGVVALHAGQRAGRGRAMSQSSAALGALATPIRAELLMQLSQFEAYSADCEVRSLADAALHAHLQQEAAASRALFESALERVALHEGILLPQHSRWPSASALGSAAG